MPWRPCLCLSQSLLKHEQQQRKHAYRKPRVLYTLGEPAEQPDSPKGHRSQGLKGKMYTGLWSRVLVMKLLHFQNEGHLASQSPTREEQLLCGSPASSPHLTTNTSGLGWKNPWMSSGWGREGTEATPVHYISALVCQRVLQTGRGPRTTRLPRSQVWAIPLTSKVHIHVMITPSSKPASKHSIQATLGKESTFPRCLAYNKFPFNEILAFMECVT